MFACVICLKLLYGVDLCVFACVLESCVCLMCVFRGVFGLFVFVWCVCTWLDCLFVCLYVVDSSDVSD